MVLTWINSTRTLEIFQHVYDPLGVATVRQTWDSFTRFFIDQAAARQMQLKLDLPNHPKDCSFISRTSFARRVFS